MKMKWKSVLLASFAGIGLMFSACSSEDNGFDGRENPEGETGFFSFSLSTHPNAISTRLEDYEEIGDAGEATVKEGLLALYDAKSQQLKYKFPLAVNNTGGTFTGTSVSTSNGLEVANGQYTFTMKAVEVVKQDYLMLVVLNPTEDMKKATDATKSMYYLDFEKEKDALVEDFADDTNEVYTDIVMSNSRGLAKVTEDMFHKTEKEAEDAKTANGKMPAVSVDRILAKVLFKRADNITMPEGATFGTATWMLDITNKSTHWVRLQAAAGGNNGAQQEIWNTPRNLLYAIDPNWDGVSQLRQNKPFVELADFNYYAKTDFAANGKALSTSFTREYVLENTMAAEEQWEDVTTRILLEGNYIPKGFNANDSYYFYGGAAFTHEQIYKMMEDDKKPEEDRENLWPTTPSGLKEAVLGSGFNFNVNTEPTTSLTDPNGLIHYYYKGVNYYYILVRHFDDDIEGVDMQYGRYGIVRNNVYKVTLTKIAGPGTPEIPTPEGPDDKKKEYISAQIEVLPWVVRTQEAEI